MNGVWIMLNAEPRIKCTILQKARVRFERVSAHFTCIHLTIRVWLVTNLADYESLNKELGVKAS